MTRKTILLLYLISVFLYPVFSQKNILEYNENFTISEGLAHNGVTDILEDSRGFIWVSTYDGLNKYNGYEFITYKNNLDKEIFVSNRIRTIKEDYEGNIWIGTDDGITVYNYLTERFINIYSNKQNHKKVKGPIVRRFAFTKKYILCATEDAGILQFDYNYKLIDNFYPENTSLKNLSFYDLTWLDENNYIICSSTGVFHFSLINKTFQSISGIKQFNSNTIITKFDSNSFLTTENTGFAIIEYQEKNNSFSFKIKSRHLTNHQFTSVSIDKLGNLWLGTLNNGIIHIDNANSFINNEKYELKYFKGKGGLLRVSSINTSNKFGCLVGTYNKGIFSFDLKRNSFYKFNTQLNMPLAPKSNHITFIAKYDTDRVILSAHSDGLSFFNTRTHLFEKLPFDFAPSLLSSISIVYTDSKNNIWFKLGTQGDLYKVAKGKTTPIPVRDISNAGLSNFAVHCISEDKKGNLLLGGDNNLIRVNINQSGVITDVETLNSNSSFQKLREPIIRRLYIDPEFDILWAGTDFDGLLRIQLNNTAPLKNLKIDRFAYDKDVDNSLSSNFVTSITRLPNGELWIGTEGGGVCKVVNSNTKPVFIPYTEKNGLSNNVVKNIWFDNEYNLWISTNIGLNKLDTKSLRFRQYSKEDGLPFEDFWYSTARLDNGFFIVSGLDGFCYFNPNELPASEDLPNLEFGNLQLNNNTIQPGDTVNGRVLFNKRFSDVNELTLKHNENIISIEVLALHYSNAENHHLKYKLSPINPEWIEIPSNRRFLNYSGLPPGEYLLQVMASNSLNKWTEPKELKITIVPPFWKTGKAYILYFIILGLIVYVVIFFILRIQSLKHNLQIEQLEKDKEKEVNAAKLRFFSNISHEIKTPLTLIRGPINILAERFKANNEINEKLQIVMRQSKKMSQLVDQVHDFQKASANMLKMRSTRFCFDNFVHNLILDFDFKARNEGKKLICKGGEQQVHVLADKDKLEKILNNLLSNAFKYTKENDTIKVVYQANEGDLIIEVSDTGQGIDKDDLPYIFERFYQSKSKHSTYVGGSGIGLAFTKRLIEMHYGYIKAESVLHKGTKIIVRLPIVKAESNIEQDSVEKEILNVEREFSYDNKVQQSANIDAIISNNEFNGSKIFLAEDNTELRLFMVEALSRFFKVKAFSNGKKCLEEMENEWPDIVISDVLMPELNGFDLCKEIKSDIKTSHIPVILLTACTTTEDQIKGIKDGADAYILKPFDFQQLVTHIESVLQIRKQLKSRFRSNFPLALKKNDKTNNDIAFLEKLYNLIEKNLDNQELNLDDFAKELYLNRTHFYQKVKAITNFTPFELLKTYRLKKAAEFLGEQGYSINEVVSMTGFKSRAHFSKLFKEKFNITPGKFISDTTKKA